MKRVLIFTICCSILVAEESFELEIQTPLDAIEIPSMHKTTTGLPQQESFDDPQVVSIPQLDAPLPILMPTQEVELSSEQPTPLIPKLQLAPMIVDLPAPTVVHKTLLDADEDVAAILQEEQEVAQEIKSAPITIDLRQVLGGSPTIYSILFLLSTLSVGIWMYALLSLRQRELFPPVECTELKCQIQACNYDSALAICQKKRSLLFGMVATALTNRHHGQETMLELMRAEGKRMTVAYWQKIGLLNEIAVIAPMIGLLGTVLGLFYAFYDLNRSAESISALFDGLGISVGTTLGGLIVAILALIFHAMTKYRLMRQLTRVESEAQQLIHTITATQNTQRPS